MTGEQVHMKLFSKKNPTFQSDKHKLSFGVCDVLAWSTKKREKNSKRRLLIARQQQPVRYFEAYSAEPKIYHHDDLIARRRRRRLSLLIIFVNETYTHQASVYIRTDRREMEI